MTVLDRAAVHAATFLQALPSRPIAPTVTTDELLHRLAKPLPETGLADEIVIDELVRDCDGGINGIKAAVLLWATSGQWSTSSASASNAAESYGRSPAQSFAEAGCLQSRMVSLFEISTAIARQTGGDRKLGIESQKRLCRSLCFLRTIKEGQGRDFGAMT